ncbi:MAG: hypothetical protein HYS41_05235 [Candidatus Omnitrophica bacterium]|nr:hypothetical protein [Candidatus Omnitrophota bacterium]
MTPRRFDRILSELREHVPYTIFAALMGVAALGAVTLAANLTQREALLPRASLSLFHSFHFLHLFFSAIATTAMFWRHERRVAKAVGVGFFGTVIPCSTSDILFPWIGGRWMGADTTLHVCLAEHPLLVLTFVLGGILVGFALPPITRSTLFSHGAHVLLSSMASMLYLVSFGIADWLKMLALVFLLLLASVMIPCCTSDIILPLLFTEYETSEDRARHCAV